MPISNEVRRQRFVAEFETKVREADQTILQTRIQGMGSHATFADTVLFVLRRGPQGTRSIYKEVQALHPDLCDDSIKLVISGEEWSQAKWKHRVRHAQLFLARQGRIRREDGLWILVDKPTA